MTEKNSFDEHDLDDLLAQAADRQTPASADLLARIIADAERIDADRTFPEVTGKVPKPGILATLLASVGGWPAVAGLATATVAGIWIGYASPERVGAFAQGYIGTSVSYDLGDYMPGFGDVLEEG